MKRCADVTADITKSGSDEMLLETRQLLVSETETDREGESEKEIEREREREREKQVILITSLKQ